MKILLAIDDSKFSQLAVRTIVRQFRAKGIPIRVLHVVEPIGSYISVDMIPHFVSHIAKVEQERRKEAKELVQRAARQLRKVGFRTSEIVEEGDPKIKIIDHAAKWNADVIVLGSHGWKGLGKFLIGSVSEAVIRHAECSVEVVRSPSIAKRARTVRGYPAAARCRQFAVSSN
jgi:nucleotide-binding universal stress UspA family protein